MEHNPKIKEKAEKWSNWQDGYQAGLATGFETGRLQGLNEALEARPKRYKREYKVGYYALALSNWADKIKSLIDKK